MSMHLSMPSGLRQTQPGEPFELKRWVFDHIPSLSELLPKFRGLPGFEYLQCCVTNLRRAQDEGWKEVENTVIYTIEGSKGMADMKLLARGQLTPGQSHDSGARLCVCDRTVEALTGVWINPQNHSDEEVVEFGEAEEVIATLPSADENTESETPEENVVFRSGGGPNAA